MKTTHQRTKVLLAWGALDAIYIAWYCLNSQAAGRVPYINDLSSSLELLGNQGGTNAATTLMSWLLQLSIVASCLLFFLRAHIAKYLAYLQAPLRLFFLIPSVSLLLLAVQILPGLSKLFLLLMIFSEVLKVWSLRRFA